MPFKVMHRKEVIHSNGSYERKSCGRKLADEMGRDKKNPIILSQLFPLNDDHTGHSKDSGSDTSRSPDIRRNCGGVSISPRGSLKVILGRQIEQKESVELSRVGDGDRRNVVRKASIQQSGLQGSG